jgi:hypothetical protein
MAHLATNYWLLVIEFEAGSFSFKNKSLPCFDMLIVFLKYPQSEFHLSADLQPLLAQS